MTRRRPGDGGRWVPAALAALLALRGLVCPLEVSVSSGSIQVARGQTAVLPCTFTTNAALTNLNVIWMVIPLSNANQPQQVILYQGGQIFGGAPQFYGRVGFAVTMPTTSASIFINNTQLSDTGTYQCLVNNLPDRGVRNIGVIGLTVLVPPSAPLCRIQGSLDVGSDITLTCSSEEGIPRPTYLWEKLDNVPKLPPTATQDQVQGTVTLRNISTVSSGLYQCVASNAIGTSTCLLDLQVIARKYFARGGLATCFCLVTVRCVTMFAVSHHVPLYQKIIMPWNGNIAFLPSQATAASCAYRWPQPIPDFFSMLCSIISTAHPRSIGLIAGAVATGAVVLVVCIVLVAVALFYWKNKHKEEEEEEIPNEIREDDLPPKCSSAAKTFHADASSSENDTLTSSNTYNSRYWNDPKANHATDSFTRFSNSNDAHQPPFSRSGSTSARPVYANGGHPSPAPPKTLVVTASTAPSPQEVIRSNGSVSRKPRLPHTRSYAVSQATLERIGAVPVMVPAQSRAGSLV
ncbi:immunoglobulin superfamily member 11 isoform X1 [Sylvia atricapilla]|uniref:immunoglobulin superfamily member 11 isoform X1 n=1 Tax=Sylvia atricapilla TaxID=48155 RepID=UPI00339359C6